MSVAWTPNPALYLSPEMVTELALGQEPPLDIAQKYGLTAAEFGALNAQAWFGEAIFRKREELQASGITFVAKAQMMAEEMWQDIYQRTKASGDGVRFEHHVLAAKELTEIAGLKPKAAAAANAGPAFTINIQLPENPQGPSMRKLEAQAMKPDPLVIEMNATVKDDLPPMPPGYKVPDFKLTHDLIGEVRPATGLTTVPLGAQDVRALPMQPNGGP